MDNDYYQPIGNSQQPAVSSVQQPTVSGQQNADENKESGVRNQAGGQNTNSLPNENAPQATGSLNMPISSAPIASPPVANTQPATTPPPQQNFNPTPVAPVTPAPPQVAPASPIPSPVPNTQPSTSSAQDESDEKEFLDFITETKEKIIDDMGFAAATQEQKDHLLETIDKRIMVAVTQAVIENATDEEAQKIRSAIEADGDVEKTVEEIVSKNPALIEKIKAKVSELYQKMLEESKIGGDKQ